MEVKKKVNNLIPMLISNGVIQRHRSLFVIVGDYGRDQVANLHHMLSQSRNRSRPSVLWCYKNELGFSSNKQRRAEKLKKQIRQGTRIKDSEDPFDMFLSSTDVTYTFYKETENVLGRTFGMLVLQDFESLTPNIIARTMETVEGGGIICLLLKSITSLKQLITLSMDAHDTYKNSAFAKDISGRFNYRFLLSLATCKQCCVVDDELNVLPISSHIYQIKKLNPDGTLANDYGGSSTSNKLVNVIDPDGKLAKLQAELKLLKSSLADTEHIGNLIKLTCTLDQAKAYLKSANILATNNPNSTVTLFAGRGRGKSATLGFTIAHAITQSYSNIFITAPSPTNVITVFEFAIKSLESLGYKQNIDFDVIESSINDFNQQHHGAASLVDNDRQSQKIITGLIIKSNPQNIGGHGDLSTATNLRARIAAKNTTKQHHRQTITFIQPKDSHLLTNCDLLFVDEAAAIPLPHILRLMKGGITPGVTTSTSTGSNNNNYIVFLSSTINGYEGSGRELTLKLIKTLREQTTSGHYSALSKKNKTGSSFSSFIEKNQFYIQNRTLEEISLSEPIRYGSNDAVESWMNKLLCLDCVNNIPKLITTSTNMNNNTMVSLKQNDTNKGLPHPSQCSLFYVSRDTLFSYHEMSEHLLQQIMALYVSSHYKNTPNDLQILADAPQHHLFVLLGPLQGGQKVPSILALAQISLEGNISHQTHDQVINAQRGGDNDDEQQPQQRQAKVATTITSQGDLIPWAISQQYLTRDFAQLTGGRFYRLAVHPDIQHMGYGSRLMELIINYYDGKMHISNEDNDSDDDNNNDDDDDSIAATLRVQNTNNNTTSQKKDNKKNNLLTEEISLLNRTALPPLFLSLAQRKPEVLHWLGASFGITPILHRFFKKYSFYPLYLKQTPSQTTGEYSTIMIRAQITNPAAKMLALQRGIVLSQQWLQNLFVDFRAKLINTLGYAYNDLPAIFISELCSKFDSFYHQKTLQQQQQLLLENAKLNNMDDDNQDDDDDENESSKQNTKKLAAKNDIEVKHTYSNDEDQKKAKLTKLATGNEIIDTNEFASSTLTRHLIYELFTPFDLKRLDNYCNNMIDYSLILNTIPHLARLYFLNKISLDLTNFQQAILLGVGLQHKTLSIIENELQIGPTQVLALFNKSLRRLTQCLRFVEEREIATTIANQRVANANVIATTLKARQTSETMAEDMIMNLDKANTKTPTQPPSAATKRKSPPQKQDSDDDDDNNNVPEKKAAANKSGAVKRTRHLK